MIWTPLGVALPFIITYITMPFLIKKMKEGGIVGRDINKPDRPEVAEMGGIGGLFGFAIGTTIVIGLLKLEDFTDEIPILVAVSVFSFAAIVGLLDDIAVLYRSEKAILIILASLPLIISTVGEPKIDLIITTIEFKEFYLNKIYWIILVPIGITGMANALNMSAGYNGLESGQFSIISFSLLTVNYFEGAGNASYLIFGGLFGSSLAIYLFNKYPAKVFVGDVGTLGFGATLAAGIIMANFHIYGLICILPAFYELFATIYYKMKNVERRDLCHNPIILEDGRLQTPPGAEKYTLYYRLLSIRSMTEKDLVNVALSLYVVCGIIAILLSALS